MILPADTQALVAQLAGDIGITEAEAVHRSVDCILMIRGLLWLQTGMAP